MTDYLRRVAAAQATRDRFYGRPFVWGETDCARLAAHVLRELGRPAPLSRFGRYSTALGAARALRRRGFADLGAVLDDMGLPRIPPAAALPGDIVGLEGEASPLTALTVALGGRRVIGFHGEAEMTAAILEPRTFRCAWRSI